MPLKIGINGFGRIGRAVYRASLDYSEKIQVVAVNDLADGKTLAHLLKYDSVHGTFNHEIESTEKSFRVNDNSVIVTAQHEPLNIPWGDMGVDIVVEATGLFTDKENASKHIQGGAKKTLVTAPGKNVDLTLVLGANKDEYRPDLHNIISCASCTTNCLAPIIKIIHEKFGIIRGMMTTIHSYTNDQQILDLPHKDLRRARAAALSIIPTTTGAAKAVASVLPDLKGRLHGMAMRVPTPNVSAVDLVVHLKHKATAEEINELLKNAAQNELLGILAYCDKPLVSKDFNGNPNSCIIDALSTTVLDDIMVKLVAWYDNEWGYSNRVIDTALFIHDTGY